jgi:primary-amine oxidase
MWIFGSLWSHCTQRKRDMLRSLRPIYQRASVTSIVHPLQPLLADFSVKQRFISSPKLTRSVCTMVDVASYYVPLTFDEISQAADVIRTHEKAGTNGDSLKKLRFSAISLKEPSKADVLKAQSTEEFSVPRQAEAVTINPMTGLASEFVVDLKRMKVVKALTLPPGKQPLFSPDDLTLVEDIVQGNEVVAAALKERYSIDDMSRVACDPWSMNMACEEDWALTKWRSNPEYNKDTTLATDIPGRLVQVFMYHRQHGTAMEDNHYAHPIDIVPIVDLNSMSLVTIEGMDRLPPPKIPTESVQYHRDLLSTNSYLETTWRNDVLKSLNISQPDGPSFTVSKENVVEWQKWKFQVGFNYREGLVLHKISFDGRPVVDRAALVEMAVPYADITQPGRRKCAFDVGDYGLGYCANSLELGCDCLGHIHYFDVVLPDAGGNPILKKKAICMHEEDQGILWKHVEYRNGHNESRRARELVISSISTVVNYEYLFYWRLKQDGSIEFNIKLSGELSTNLLSAAEEPSRPHHGVMVTPNVNAQIHQHMFCARLDMAVDGFDNVVSEVDVVPVQVDPMKNPWGNAFVPVETILESEKAAIRMADATKARVWKIAHASKTNPINGKSTAYKLVPFTRGPAQPIMLTDPSSAVSKKGAFANANLWVTPYTEEERFPAGEYTPQGNGSFGLPDWTASNRSLLGQSNGLVLWHAFGVCHVPRIEDFPVMPCEITGFTLKPDNFFSGNPAIDLAPDKNCASRLADGCSEQ